LTKAHGEGFWFVEFEVLSSKLSESTLCFRAGCVYCGARSFDHFQHAIMAKVQRFEDLLVWQKARQLTRRVYAMSRDGQFARDFG
jgi:hypothetical protein